MEENFRKKLGILTITAALTVTAAGCGSMIFAKDREITDTEGNGKITITNVSYDPTREFYEVYNGLFENYYKETYGVVWTSCSHTVAPEVRRVPLWKVPRRM